MDDITIIKKKLLLNWQAIRLCSAEILSLSAKLTIKVVCRHISGRRYRFE
jgi:hypothetical protein